MSTTLDILRSAVSTNDSVAEALGGLDKLLDQLGFSLRASENIAWLQSALRDGPQAGSAKLDGLAAALRAGALAEVSEADLDYVADQRVLRIILLLVRQQGMPAPYATVVYSPAEQRLAEHLKQSWIAGFRDGQQRVRRARGTGRYVGGN